MFKNNSYEDYTKIEIRLQHIADQFTQLQLYFNTQQRNNESYWQKIHQQFDQYQLQGLKLLQDSIQNNFIIIQKQLQDTLEQNKTRISETVDKLSQIVEKHLIGIHQKVEEKLSEGFAKTTATFQDVIKRLALIDEAQKRITELSSNVVSLQDILNDKRSRGAFGEVQLSALIRNMLPESHFKLQYTLTNSKRADCILFLPEPTGNIIIDAKFPLENYRRLNHMNLVEAEKKIIEQQFKQDIRQHIQDIATKYIIPNQTADGAMMFIPAEAIFADIYNRYADLVELAYKNRIWIVSPTTLMAILTTARAVIKDAATRKQIHIIQEHLGYLSQDFERFHKRISQLAKHIGQAQSDMQEIHISANKITKRFHQIENADTDTLLSIEKTPLEVEE